MVTTENRKYWFAFGDSITDMGYYIDTVCADLGVTCEKYGFSGYSYGIDGAGFGSLRDACTLMLRSRITPDIITLFGGTNDFGHSSPEPEMEAALRDILKRLRARWPRTKLLVLTPLQRNFRTEQSPCEAGGLGPNRQGLYLIDYVSGIRRVAREAGVPLLDLYEKGGLTMENARVHTLDGLHPTPQYGVTLGHLIAARMRRDLSEPSD